MGVVVITHRVTTILPGHPHWNEYHQLWAQHSDSEQLQHNLSHSRRIGTPCFFLQCFDTNMGMFTRLHPFCVSHTSRQQPHKICLYRKHVVSALMSLWRMVSSSLWGWVLMRAPRRQLGKSKIIMWGLPDPWPFSFWLSESFGLLAKLSKLWNSVCEERAKKTFFGKT